MRKIGVLLILAVLVANHNALSQVNAEQFQLDADKLNGTITLDGQIKESAWQNASKADNFILTFPVDSLPATSQTEVMITFDDQFLYIGGICHVSSRKKHVVQSLRRDFSWGSNDNFSVYIDPYDDYTNGFAFSITPYGVRREGLLVNGSEVYTDWDNKWYSEVTDFGDRWEFEMKIPFKTLRYDEKNQHWNVIFLRKDLKNNQESTWAPVPQGYNGSSLAFAGRLNFTSPLKKAGANIAVIPYVSAAANKDYQSDDSNSDFNAGFDAKIGVSSSLNLDLTVNPDFSQVEVDRQVTNLSRFEIFFPERRQFFLENQDLFGQGGFPQSRPFFSRRIGIAQDTLGNKLQIPILYGARLSGKVGKNWRLGIMNMQTKKQMGAQLTGVASSDSSNYLLAQNYTVGVLQRRIFGRSNIGVVMVNRQALDYKNNERRSATSQYNRVFGVDYNLLSTNGRWEGDFFYHRSLDEKMQDHAFSTGGFLGYTTTNLELRASVSAIGDGFNAETGFIPRKDIIDMGTFNDYNFYPKNSAFIVRHGPGMRINYKTDLDFNVTDINYSANYEFIHYNTSRLEVGWSYDYIKLRSPFDPTGSGVEDSLKLQSGDDFDWNTVYVEYGTDGRQVFSGQIEGSYGGFFNGKRFNTSLELTYRYQPYGLVALAVDYNNLHAFGTPFQDTEFWLIGPRIDLTFTDKLFLTTFVQYNEQADNVNLNMRFQWRYKPVSDIFVVYTDNYLPNNFMTKNRAIVFKLTYWLNF